MSYEARTWAWHQAKTRTIDDPLDLLILLNLADVADQYGGNSYPSQARLVEDCLSSERTIRRRLTALIERGILEVQAPATRTKPTTYRLVGVSEWAANMAGQRDITAPLGGQSGRSSDGLAANDRPLGGHLAATVVRNSSDELEQEEEDVSTENTRGDTQEGRLTDDPEKLRGKGSDYRFEDAWTIYPPRRGRRVGKDKARGQWKKLTYAEKGRCYRAIKAFAAEHPEYPPDMFRWLRDGTWKDYLEPAAAAPAAGPSRPARKGWDEMTEEEFAVARRTLTGGELTEALEARHRAAVLRGEA